MKIIIHKQTVAESIFEIIEDGNVIETKRQQFNVTKLAEDDFIGLYNGIVDVKKVLASESKCDDIDKMLQEKDALQERVNNLVDELKDLKEQIEQKPKRRSKSAN